MSFMQLHITAKGRLATIECQKCGQTTYWHEWTSEGQPEDLVTARCPECGGKHDPDTLWQSPGRTWYAGRYSADGYLDCTDWSYSRNKRQLARELNEMYGE